MLYYNLELFKNINKEMEMIIISNRLFCSKCYETRIYELKEEERKFIFDGKEITYDLSIYLCKTCGADIPNNELLSKNVHRFHEAVSTMITKLKKENVKQKESVSN